MNQKTTHQQGKTGTATQRRMIDDQEQAVAALRESEQRFRAIFDGTFQFIGLLKPDGTLIEANKTALEFIGVPAGEVVGRPFWETPWWSGCPQQQERLKSALVEAAQGKFVRFEAQHLGKDGATDIIDFSVRPIFDDAGRVALIIPEGRRITERKRAEQALRDSEERFRALVEASSQIVWTTDEQGMVVEDSPSWRAFTGQSYDQWSGSGWLDAYHPDDHEQILTNWRRVLAEKTPLFAEYRLRRCDGEWRWTQVRAVPLLAADNTVRGWVGMNTDITDRKRLEQELQLRMEELRESDRRKDEFIAMLAHELRNPLAPIRNVINLLEKKVTLEPVVQRATDIISRQIDHFTRLIDDLLDVSRITRDKLELRKARVELTEIVNAAVEISRPLIDRNGHRLRINLPAEPIYLDADAIRLSQVFMNLLNNAAKYTPQGGLINLSAERHGHDVAVRIADNGIGIASDQLAKLFDMFYQADCTYEQSQGGLGIGLTLVQRLVEMHGGKVEAHSAGPNRGSEFVVRLPLLAAQSEVQHETEAVENFPSPARRILVVDDYGDSADTLAELLGFDGNDVRVAHDGLEALEIAENFRPRVALLDLGMPKLNGYETASKIREQPWGEKMFLVAVTGWGEEDVMERTKEAGFDAHILKPVDYSKLSKLLADFLSRDVPVDVAKD